MMIKRVIILGGGISGLSAAWRFVDSGIEVDILEKSPSIGGLAGTVREGPYSMDLGPHSFFSEDRKIIETVLGLFDNKLKPTPRSVKFYHNKKYIDYPFTARSLFLQMGLRFSAQAGLGLMKSRLFAAGQAGAAKDEETVEDWAINNFGEYLYRTFFKPYTEQFWKIPCSQLSARSIPTHTKLTFINTFRSILSGKPGRSEKSMIEREMLPTYYPKNGFAEIAERIARSIVKNHGHIHTGCETIKVRTSPSGKVHVSYYQFGQLKELAGDHIISTIPLPSLVKALDPRVPSAILASANKLLYQPLIILGMVTKKQNVLKCGYVYLLNSPFNRLFEMNSFSPFTSPRNENIIGAEITCREDSPLWRSGKEELFNLCINGLTKEGFLKHSDVNRLILAKAPHAYPIYRKGHTVHLIRIMNYLKELKPLTTLGRCGEFMYMEIDRCVKMAFGRVDRLITNADRRITIYACQR